jgi:hypothetical protein
VKATLRRTKCSIFDVNLEPITAGDITQPHLRNGTGKSPSGLSGDQIPGVEFYVLKTRMSLVCDRKRSLNPGAYGMISRQEIEDDAVCRRSGNGSPVTLPPTIHFARHSAPVGHTRFGKRLRGKKSSPAINVGTTAFTMTTAA